MEIGGYDTLYETADPRALMESIKHWTGWLEPVVEDHGATDQEGWFFYRSQADKDAWDDDVGPDEGMIYFIVEPGCLTVVTDGILTAGIRQQFPPSKEAS
jgi:hypothetical protein